MAKRTQFIFTGDAVSPDKQKITMEELIRTWESLVDQGADPSKATLAMAYNPNYLRDEVVIFWDDAKPRTIQCRPEGDLVTLGDLRALVNHAEREGFDPGAAFGLHENLVGSSPVRVQIDLSLTEGAS